MTSLAVLAVATPIIALIIVAAYAAFEYRLIERAAMADKLKRQERDARSYEAAPAKNYEYEGMVYKFEEHPETLKREFYILTSEDEARHLAQILAGKSYRQPGAPASAEELLAELGRITARLRNLIGERLAAKP